MGEARGLQPPYQKHLALLLEELFYVIVGGNLAKKQMKTALFSHFRPPVGSSSPICRKISGPNPAYEILVIYCNFYIIFYITYHPMRDNDAEVLLTAKTVFWKKQLREISKRLANNNIIFTKQTTNTKLSPFEYKVLAGLFVFTQTNVL